MKKISLEDSALFRQAVEKLKPLRREAHVSAIVPQTSLIDLNIRTVEADEKLFFCRSGGITRRIRQFKRGNILLQAEYDLHGLTAAEAHREIDHFIHMAIQRRYHCISMIHGKGMILKNLVNRILRGHPAVSAFCSAPPHKGGAGAVYVLLKLTEL